MIPLTVRSHYSLMWGTASIGNVCRTARRLGYSRLALTDTDNLYGLWPFLAACRREGLTPIIGAEITDPGTKRRAVCLVATDEGYTNLCRMITRRHMISSFHLARDLPDFAKGLVVLTQDAELLTAWHDAGVTVAGAIPRHPVSRDHRLGRTARHLGVQLVATPGSFFLDPEDYAIHRLLRAIDLNTSLSRLGPADVAPDSAWLAGPGEYERRFAICPEALSASHELADYLSFTGPDFGLVMPPWEGDRHRGADRCLRAAAYTGARKRYGLELPEPIVERLEHELGIIRDMNFSAYFLIVRDIVKRSSRTCGRGSGAASLIAYCLKITNVCPVKHNLYFGRFLNPGRKDPPDIDVDFAWDERDDVLDDVLTRFAGRAAMVSSHVLFQPRMAVRETAKVFGLTDGEIGQVSKRLPWFWRVQDAAHTFLKALKERPETKTLDFLHPWPEILGLAQRIIGIPRYMSVHPGGIVITPDQIDRYVPVEKAAKGVPIIQWDKDAAEDAGLVKIDLLGNRSLGVIRDVIGNIKDNDVDFDDFHWEPEDDFATQEAVAQGQTMGCFYIESPAMRQLQQKSRVGDFDHLVIHSSIIRPAANEYIQEYIRRLHGGNWDPIHPLLSDVLAETFGIMVYQEDVSRAAVALADFSDADADGLRKILSKKDREFRMGDYRQQFVSGARRKGVADQQIDAVWSMMMSFSGYSFCKPHSASYARVSFQAAYLKTHFPAEFMAAVISNQGGFYGTFAYVSEARRQGVAILPPDVNISQIRWRGCNRTMRVGLQSVKGLSANCMQRIIHRRRTSLFSGLADFLDRVRPDEPEARALIHCGALDAFHPEANRAALLWELMSWRHVRSERSKWGSLFDLQPMNHGTPPKLPPENPRDRLRREFRTLGFLCGRHPMTLYADVVAQRRTTKAADLPRYVGKNVRIAAWLITGKVVRTKHGDPMEFLTFEDETGVVETTFFPEIYRRFCHMIDWGRPYLLSGTVEQDWGAITLTVNRAEALAALPA
ncbi:MAG: DNA polymerase III subunit alpha [Desulfobacteraceae bacterium]|nr:DNA polymerase III subunit alpha [Desulfobacteraceae bacterium]